MPCSPSVFVQCIGCLSADATGLSELRDSVLGERPGGIRPTSTMAHNRTLHYGLLQADLPTDATPSRTASILRKALEQMPSVRTLTERFLPQRIAVVLGASTSGMKETEEAMAQRDANGAMPENFDIRTLNLHEPSRLVAQWIGAKGPVYTISNACASGAMAMISAARLLQAGLADAVVTGGMDGASRFTTMGFDALGALSESPCLPFRAERCGINLGEGGALLLLTREPSAIELSGWAETSDAHHISAPHPEGKGAAACMRAALQSAGLAPDDIDFISAHGTATPLNDAAESTAIAEVFGANVPVASLKWRSGHTLAGAGALQGAIACALLADNETGRLPFNTPDGTPDPSCNRICLQDAPAQLGRPLRHVLCNAFAFGGSNATLIFSRREV